MGTGLFLGVKRPWHGVKNPPPYTVEVKERAKLYLYFSSGPSWTLLRLTLLLLCFVKQKPKYNLLRNKQRNINEKVLQYEST
jgi:hypothetical protein